MPEVSVVIPAYNAESTLRETLMSVLDQTLTNFEVLIIDDGSHDATAAVATDLGDPRIRVISTPNAGVSRARNLGIAQSQGQFVAFLDADDTWAPDKLERQIALMKVRPEVGLCVTGGVRIDADSQFLSPMLMFEQSDDYTRDLLLNCSIAGCTCSGVVRRELLDAVGGFSEELEYCEDWGLWLTLSVRTVIGVIAKPLVQVRMHERNSSGNPFVLERDTLRVLDAFFATPESAPYRGMRARAYGAQLMVCAGSYLHKRHPLRALRCLGRSLLIHPAGFTYPLGLPRRLLGRIFRDPMERAT